jgi:hypothetical protein
MQAMLVRRTMQTSRPAPRAARRGVAHEEVGRNRIVDG